MTLKIDTNFEGKLMCASENAMTNLANFHQSTLESPKIGFLMASFCLKLKVYELKVYKRVMCLTLKNDPRFEEELTCQFNIYMGNLTNFERSTQKTQKITL